MAFLYPSLESILLAQSYQPTSSELLFVDFLKNNLSDEYEIFFKPMLNGDSPDIVLLKRTAGVLIFNILDNHIQEYRIEGSSWYWTNEDGIEFEMLSPIDRGRAYKDNLYNLHIDKLQELLRTNKNYFTIVNCCTFFSKDSRATIGEDFFNKAKYHGIISKDDLNAFFLNNLLSRFYFHRTSQYFTLDLYSSFKRNLIPPIHRVEEGRHIVYSKEQERFLSSSQEQKRIHGVAGSGKTLVLARRAVNAHIRTKSRVLILTFNKTLRNYIQDRINDIREEFPWSAFTILHYHEFFKASATNHNLKVKSIKAFENVNFFELKKANITKYQVLIIDEIQDYREEWFRILKKYFLIENGEFVVFGDSKQDIYQRKAMDTVPIQGRPSVLKKSYRLSLNIAALATKFQEYFFVGNHEIEKIEVAEQAELFKTEGAIEYFSFNDPSNFEAIYSVIMDFLERNEIHQSDAAILSARTEIVAELDYFIRTRKHTETTRIFEPLELRKQLEQEIEDSWLFEERIDKLRDNLKRHFVMNTGLIKISSIHSFKGWETDTVFLLIEGEIEGMSNTFTTDELIYVGLTRAKRNLIILNLDNSKYGEFFEELLS